MLAAAQACLIYKVPIAHLYGGEITEGAYDDAIRHAITKLSHLHFTDTEEYRQHVIQMGEQPNHVYYVGSLGVYNMLHEELMPQDILEQSLNFKLGEKYLLITFHPVTMEQNTAASQCDILLKALSEINNEYKLLFTLPNSDTDGRVIISKINEYVSLNPNHAYAVPSLGRKRYHSALKYAKAVVGNSSSGLIEAPSFHIPTLNVGDRQKGRTRGNSIIDVQMNLDAIRIGLQKVLSLEFKEITSKSINPYEKVGTLENIFKVVKSFPLGELVCKKFYKII
jgi:UDP-N-acetylglucosamine 2-epimerase (non-hydrolysing)/GDP/UDP-N,N'-diacetylbacillosamine 2-epimerase (hydrolysing)